MNDKYCNWKPAPEDMEKAATARSFLDNYRLRIRERKDAEERLSKIRKQKKDNIEFLQKLAINEEQYQAIEERCRKYAEKCEELEAFFEKKLNECTGMELRILSSINSLNAGQYTDDMNEILIMRYVDGLEWKEIASRLCLSRRTCQYRELQALMLLVY